MITIFFLINLHTRGEICLEIEVINCSLIKVRILILMDYISMIFFGTVLLISSRVFIFRSSYIGGDKVYSRFIWLVIFFVLRMMFLIFSPSLLRLLLGWDGLGVTSYLLVRFYRSEKSFNARIITVLTNRLGDVAILSFIAFNTTPAFFNYGIIGYQYRFNFFFLMNKEIRHF